MAAAAEPYGTAALVLQAVDGDAVRLKQLASAIVERPGLVAVLVSRTAPVLAVVARSADVLTPCNEVISGLAKQFGGRGGGKPDLAQCGSLQAEAGAVLAAARTLLASATS
jgi:alanyl-tRNA synthetase